MISVPEPEGDSTIVVEYDPQKSAVLRATWQNGTPERPWARCDYELQETDRLLGAQDHSPESIFSTARSGNQDFGCQSEHGNAS